MLKVPDAQKQSRDLVGGSRSGIKWLCDDRGFSVSQAVCVWVSVCICPMVRNPHRDGPAPIGKRRKNTKMGRPRANCWAAGGGRKGRWHQASGDKQPVAREARERLNCKFRSCCRSPAEEPGASTCASCQRFMQWEGGADPQRGWGPAGRQRDPKRLAGKKGAVCGRGGG